MVTAFAILAMFRQINSPTFENQFRSGNFSYAPDFVPGPFCQVSSVVLQLGREIWRRVLCGITGLCIADKRSQHLENFQQIDGKTLSSIDGKTLSSIDEMTLSSSCWRL